VTKGRSQNLRGSDVPAELLAEGLATLTEAGEKRNNEPCKDFEQPLGRVKKKTRCDF
jgi:hypothetical protein